MYSTELSGDFYLPSDKELLVLPWVAAPQLQARQDLLSWWGQALLNRKCLWWLAWSPTLSSTLSVIGHVYVQISLTPSRHLLRRLLCCTGWCHSCSWCKCRIQSQHVLHNVAGAQWDVHFTICGNSGLVELVGALTVDIQVLGKSLCPWLWRGAAAAVCTPWMAPRWGCRLSGCTTWVGGSGSWVMMPVILHRLSGEAIVWLGPQIRVWFPHRLTLRIARCPSHSQDWGRRGRKSMCLIKAVQTQAIDYNKLGFPCILFSGGLSKHRTWTWQRSAEPWLKT